MNIFYSFQHIVLSLFQYFFEILFTSQWESSGIIYSMMSAVLTSNIYGIIRSYNYQNFVPNLIQT